MALGDVMTHRFFNIIILLASLLAIGQTAKASDGHDLKWLEPAQSHLFFDISVGELDLDSDSSVVTLSRSLNLVEPVKSSFLRPNPSVSSLSLEEIHPRAPPVLFI